MTLKELYGKVVLDFPSAKDNLDVQTFKNYLKTYINYNGLEAQFDGETFMPDKKKKKQ